MACVFRARPGCWRSSPTPSVVASAPRPGPHRGIEPARVETKSQMLKPRRADPDPGRGRSCTPRPRGNEWDQQQQTSRLLPASQVSCVNADEPEPPTQISGRLVNRPGGTGSRHGGAGHHIRWWILLPAASVTLRFGSTRHQRNSPHGPQQPSSAGSTRARDRPHNQGIARPDLWLVSRSDSRDRADRLHQGVRMVPRVMHHA
jgi:hypothetical protein